MNDDQDEVSEHDQMHEAERDGEYEFYERWFAAQPILDLVESVGRTHERIYLDVLRELQTAVGLLYDSVRDSSRILGYVRGYRACSTRRSIQPTSGSRSAAFLGRIINFATRLSTVSRFRRTMNFAPCCLTPKRYTILQRALYTGTWVGRRTSRFLSLKITTTTIIGSPRFDAPRPPDGPRGCTAWTGVRL
jgi:hypothetical protein